MNIKNRCAKRAMKNKKTFCILYGNAETSYFILPSLNGSLRAVKRKRVNTGSTVKCIEKLHRLCRSHRNVGDCASVRYEHLRIFHNYTLHWVLYTETSVGRRRLNRPAERTMTKIMLFYKRINIENYSIVKTFELFIENLNIH